MYIQKRKSDHLSYLLSKLSTEISPITFQNTLQKIRKNIRNYTFLFIFPHVYFPLDSSEFTTKNRSFVFCIANKTSFNEQ